MSQLSPGESVTAAHRFLRSVHSQTAALIESLDRLMAGEGWEPTHPNVTSGIGPQFNAERWLADYLYRFYFHESGTSILGGVIIQFEPPAGCGHAEPVLLAFAAQFTDPQTHATVYGNWRSSHPAFAALHGAIDFSPVDARALHQLLPNATACSGLVVPLCGLTSEEVLRTQVAEPMLAAAAAFAGA